jgi:hypothetical protein
MFPSSDNSLRTMMRRGIDAAIDFATLGEYGWSAAMEQLGDPSAFVPRPSSEALVALAPPLAGTAALPRDPRPLTMASAAAASVAPTSATARARTNTERRSVSICSGMPVRRLPVRKPASADKAPAHEQLCLLG